MTPDNLAHFFLKSKKEDAQQFLAGPKFSKNWSVLVFYYIRLIHLLFTEIFCTMGTEISVVRKVKVWNPQQTNFLNRRDKLAVKNTTNQVTSNQSSWFN